MTRKNLILKTLGASSLGLLLALQSCTSFYSSSVLGHSAVDSPTPRRSDKAVVETSLAVKTIPTVSFFTNDSTRSAQLGASLQGALPLSSLARVVFGLTGSGYFAQTSLFLQRAGSNPNSNMEEHVLDGYGLVGQGKLGLAFDQEKTTTQVGIGALYDREGGAYLDFRKQLSSLTSEKIVPVFGTTRVDLSPNGSSLEVFPYLTTQWNSTPDEQFNFTWSIGAALPDWPSHNNYVVTNRANGVFRTRNLWWGLGIESINFLNFGVGVSFGVILDPQP